MPSRISVVPARWCRPSCFPIPPRSLSWEHISLSGDFWWERAAAFAAGRRSLNLAASQAVGLPQPPPFRSILPWAITAIRLDLSGLAARQRIAVPLRLRLAKRRRGKQLRARKVGSVSV